MIVAILEDEATDDDGVTDEDAKLDDDTVAADEDCRGDEVTEDADNDEDGTIEYEATHQEPPQCTRLIRSRPRRRVELPVVCCPCTAIGFSWLGWETRVRCSLGEVRP